MPRATEIPGGHRVQFRKTAEALRTIGVNLFVAEGVELPFDSVDVVHGFQLNIEDIRACRRTGASVVISTIYWGFDYNQGRSMRHLIRDRAVGSIRGLQLLRNGSLGSVSLRRACLDRIHDVLPLLAAYEAADVLLPNAAGEATAIRSDLHTTTPIGVVPNGVDTVLFSNRGFEPAERNTVLCVGRIEPHKNQLGLVEALEGLDLRLVIVGHPHPHHLDYLDRVRKAANGKAELILGLPHSQLPVLYRRAKVHVLPTWFETTGLASLESGLSGCNIVTTSRGHAREYFGSFAWYCDPADPPTIRRAVEQALAAPPHSGLADRIRARYSWERVATTTLQAYEVALGRRDTDELPSSLPD